MLIRVCDKCHEKMGKVFCALKTWEFVVDGKLQYRLDNLEFCSLHCQQQYIINGLKGRGLDDHIKV